MPLQIDLKCARVQVRTEGIATVDTEMKSVPDATERPFKLIYRSDEPMPLPKRSVDLEQERSSRNDQMPAFHGDPHRLACERHDDSMRVWMMPCLGRDEATMKDAYVTAIQRCS